VRVVRSKALFIALSFISSFGLSSARGDIFVYNDPQGVVRFTSAPTEPAVAPLLSGLSAWPRTNWNWRSWHFFSRPVGRTDGPRRKAYDSIIQAAAKRNQVEVALIKAVIRAESDFVPHAVSPKGALGLMQLMPAT